MLALALALVLVLMLVLVLVPAPVRKFPRGFPSHGAARGRDVCDCRPQAGGKAGKIDKSALKWTAPPAPVTATPRRAAPQTASRRPDLQKDRQ